MLGTNPVTVDEKISRYQTLVQQYHAVIKSFLDDENYGVTAADQATYGSSLTLRSLGLIKIKEHGESLLAYVKENSFIERFLDDFIQDVTPYLVYYDNEANTTSFAPFFSECACQDLQHCRLRNDYRSSIENDVITDVCSAYAKQNILNYTGFGAGGLLQEFILLVSLIKLGYAKIDVVLIDPQLDKRALIEFQSLLTDYAACKNAQVSISSFSSVSDYTTHQPGRKSDIIIAIDFADMSDNFSDVMKMHLNLSDRGRMYLTRKSIYYCWTANDCVRYANRLNQEKSDVYNQVMQQLNTYFASQSSPLVALVTPYFCEEFFTLQLIPVLIESSNLKHLTLSMAHPLSRNFFGGFESQYNLNYTEQNLQQFIHLFTHNAPVQVTLHKKPLQNKVDFSGIPKQQGFFFIAGVRTSSDQEIEQLIGDMKAHCKGTIFCLLNECLFIYNTTQPENFQINCQNQEIANQLRSLLMGSARQANAAQQVPFSIPTHLTAAAIQDETSQKVNEIVQQYKLKDNSPTSLAQGLRRAAAGNHVADILFLVEVKQINVDTQDNNIHNQKTALHWAVREGATKAVNTLLKLGARTDIPDAFGKTAKYFAIEKNNPDILQALKLPAGTVSNCKP